MSVLRIKNLHVKIDNKKIIKGLDLVVKSGEVHAIMGPNGTGKSTLAQAIMGHPKYETKGLVEIDNQDILDLTVDERAKAGLFLAMQYPIEVSGVTNAEFMRQALRSVKDADVPLIPFVMEYEKNAKELKMNADLPHRYLNEGFSGGERKRNEILQLKTLKPKFAILDEIDSGLDIDALKIVGENVSSLINPEFGCILITHYQRILQYIKPTHVHIMLGGKIVLTGGIEVINKIEANGYQWLKDELGLEIDLGNY